jgi:hypothetical protein
VGACTPSIKREFLQISHDSKKQNCSLENRGLLERI